MPVTKIIADAAVGTNTPNAITATAASGKYALDVNVVNQSSSSSASVEVTNLPAIQPVSGTVGVNNFPTTQGVSGTVNVGNFPATQPVSLATMPSTPVTGTFWQATQPISGTVAANAGTNLNTSALALDSTVNTLLKPASTLAAVTAITNTVTTSLGNSAGKTNVMKTGTLVTTAVTADQVILTYTVTSGKTLYLEYFDISCRLTAFAATATNFGNASLESPAATKLYTQIISGSGVVPAPVGIYFSEPVPVAAGTVIRIVCTPSATTSFTWVANFGGYEK